MKKPKTAIVMDQVWQRLMAFAREDSDNESEIARAFNQMLDDLLEEDFFGTEGQSDPRGDHRDA